MSMIIKVRKSGECAVSIPTCGPVYRILNSRNRPPSPDDQGKCMLIDTTTGAIVLGWKYDAGPTDVADFIIKAAAAK